MNKNSTKLFLVALLTALQGCTYHFANAYYKPPKGIKTLYIESVYDTSGAAVPHQVLWENLQRVFAADGRIVLSNSKYADAYLRVHLKKVQEGQFETARTQTDDDPRFQDLQEAQKFSSYQNLNQASEYAKKGSMQVMVTADFYRLQPEIVMLSSKNYSSSATFLQLDTKVGPLSFGIRAREARNNSFYNISLAIANSIKADFLRRQNG